MININICLCISTVVCVMATIRLFELCKVTDTIHLINISSFDKLDTIVDECINVQLPSYTLNDKTPQDTIILVDATNQDNPPSYISGNNNPQNSQDI